MATDLSLYKLPPQNIEAEQSVLGAILIEPDAINKVISILDPGGEDFYRDAHKKIFRLMVSFSNRENEPIDLVTLPSALKDIGILESVGGVSYLTALMESTPTAANVVYYAKIVREKALLRKLIGSSTDVITRCYNGGEKIEDLLDDAEKLIFEVAQDKTKRSFYHIKDLVKATFKTIEDLSGRDSHVTGVPTGFDKLDGLTSGLQPSDLIVIAGRPSMGKTAFCLNIAQNAAESENPVAIFSLEMSKEQLVQRLLASRAKVDLHRIRSGKLRNEDWSKLTTAIGVLHEAPIFIDDTPAQSVLEIKAKARRLAKQEGIKLVIVDYLQLMRGRHDADNREQEISDISRSLKAMAKELHVPVIALSQLSRMPEQREDKRPHLADLRESGAIEQDADVVAFVYREVVYTRCKCPEEIKETTACSCERSKIAKNAEVIVEKQRNGPTGPVKLTFLAEYTSFENQAPGYYAAPPPEWVE
ncbi:MAG: replicative DNA helicase [Deltaproteobacteria bacterium RIFCSPLOWO2_02_44_9]|nr:MAG: replicative DNA helicase [Deltaproteobacteria bacterium RIFCSPLOWO2_02_44_9]